MDIGGIYGRCIHFDKSYVININYLHFGPCFALGSLALWGWDTLIGVHLTILDMRVHLLSKRNMQFKKMDSEYLL